MHPKHFGSHVTIRPSIHTTEYPKWNDRFYSVCSLQPVFKLMTEVHVVVIFATCTFREKKQQQSRIIFSTKFTVYADLDNRERARARDKKQGDEFCKKHNNKNLKRWWENEKC